MSTSGGFNPPPQTACSYSPFMTRAEALARRSAGTLVPGCPVIITDGPVIGTAGDTSPTQIRLDPSAPVSLGTQAQVRTVYPDAGLWNGTYDIDAGPSGTLWRLSDNWGNSARDSTPGASTVHNQVPWHRGGEDFRDNTFDEVTLPGWSSAGGSIRSNVLTMTTVSLTGKTSGTFSRNTVTGGSLVSSAPASFIADNRLTSTAVSHTGGSLSGPFSFQGNTADEAVVSVDTATTAPVTVGQNTLSGGFRIQVDGRTAAAASITGNSLSGTGPGPSEIQVSGALPVSLSGSTVTAGRLVLAGPASLQYSRLSGAAVTHQGSGNLVLSVCDLTDSSVTLTPASTRGLELAGVAATGSALTQNGSGSSAADTFPAGTGTVFHRATVSLNATAATTPASVFSGLAVTSGGSLSAGDHSSAAPVQNTSVSSGAALSISGAGTASGCSLSGGAVLNLTAAATGSSISGMFTKSPGPVSINRLCDKSFDDWTG